MKIGVIGAGVLGLAIAYRLGSAHDVTVFEKDDDIGGLARPFRYEDEWIDKYYHFIFHNDRHTLAAAEDLGIGSSIGWGEPDMNLRIGNRTYPFSKAIDLLRFPLMSTSEKARFGLQTVLIGRQHEWKHLEDGLAVDWFEHIYGKRVYELLWKPLLYKKFRDHAPKVNAAWSWNEIYRRSKSRIGVGKERLGFYRGSLKILLDALRHRIESQGDRILCSSTIEQIEQSGDQVSIKTADGSQTFDYVFSTIPSKALNRYLPLEATIEAGDKTYLSVRCATIITTKPITSAFWTNVLTKDIDPMVVVEFTNLTESHPYITYVPYYTPLDHAIQRMDERTFHEENIAYLKTLNEDLTPDDIIEVRSFQDRFAHAVFTPGYSSQLEPYRTAITGLFNTNQSQIYPERSGINECFRFAELIERDFGTGYDETYYFTAR